MSLSMKRLALICIAITALSCSERGRLQFKADLGDHEAMREYGLWLWEKGHDRDGEEAIKWLKKAANSGDREAMYRLGTINAMGGGPSPEAVFWFHKGAEAGDRFCMIKLANAYEYGYLGLPKDRAEAAKWFEAARRAKKPGEM